MEVIVIIILVLLAVYIVASNKKTVKVDDSLSELTKDAKKALEYSKEEKKKLNALNTGDHLTPHQKYVTNKAVKIKKVADTKIAAIKQAETADRIGKYWDAHNKLTDEVKATKQYAKRRNNMSVTGVILGLVLVFVGGNILTPEYTTVYNDFFMNNIHGLYVLLSGVVLIPLSIKLYISGTKLQESLDMINKEIIDLENPQ